ncbi:EMC6-like membrane protein [Methanolobus halotolerans]|uniref:Uncharacterized protein n=1 Tax=Methanolobus halotolerans TaxID=2052935 RepID=A0A4E0PVK3_9EURY|nr:hypothetical protein CUN85_10060 [Methanolobus halotolerans]
MSKSSKKKQPKAAPVEESTEVAQPGQDESVGKVAYKPKTPEERKKAHVEGIIKTAVAAMLGIVAGILATMVYDAGTDTRWYAVLIIVAGFAYYIQRIIFPLIKIDTKEFGFKDWFYVEFIVIDFCLVTWTLLLN